MFLDHASTIANFLTALAYFWIPLQAFFYLAQSGIVLDQIDERLSGFARLFAGFVLFCGGHHLFMTIAMIASNPVVDALLVFMNILMAAVSVWAAVESKKFFQLVASIGVLKPQAAIKNRQE